MEGDDGTWSKFLSEENEKMSHAYLNEPSVMLKRMGHDYRVDFATMMMVKVETMHTRKIRKELVGGGSVRGGLFGGEDEVLSGDLLGTMLGGTMTMGDLTGSLLAPEPAPAPRRKTAVMCNVEGCKSLHRYTDGYCNAHRSFAKTQAEASGGGGQGEDKATLLPEFSPKAKHLASGEWKKTRRNIAMELHQTEGSFVRDLQALKDVFLLPLTGKDVLKPRESNLRAKMNGIGNTLRGGRRRSVSGGRIQHGGDTRESSKSVISEIIGGVGAAGAVVAGTERAGAEGDDDYNYLLGVEDTKRAVDAFAPLQIEQILSLNLKFSSDLSEILEGTNYSELTKLGALFMRYAHYFRYYSEYCTAHASSADALTKLEHSSRRCREYLVEVQSDPRCHGKNLSSLLICPVQRLPRYELLVRDLLKCTPIEHIDRRELVLAYRKLQSALTHVNASLNPDIASQSNSMIGMMELVKSFHPIRQQKGIAKPGRQLAHQGELVKVNHTGEKKVMSCFLFSDGLMVYGNKRQLGGGYYVERSNKQRRELKIKRVR
jgi:hypothetical protein